MKFFFRDVKVPEQNLVGREGLGWSIAKFLLGKERYFLAQTARGALSFGDIEISFERF